MRCAREYQIKKVSENKKAVEEEDAKTKLF